MTGFEGKTLSWQLIGGCFELSLHKLPCNEIGSASLDELEKFAAVLESTGDDACSLVVYSTLESGFSAGADLRELYERSRRMNELERVAEVRGFLERIHRVFNIIDSSALTTIAAVHGVTFGGGFELALTCDMIVADKTARFCFPELRLGLIPGFGGIPRLKRDIGNAVIRDLLLTGRSINATKALGIGLVSQLVAEGEAMRAARSIASQAAKFDPATRTAAKRFIKPIPHDELQREIDLFCDLFARSAVEEGLRKFVESTDPQPYLP